MPPTGPEWGLVRVEAREDDEPLFRGRYLPAGATGTQKDKAHCLFCGFTFTAAAHLIRAHVARAEGLNVKPCTGERRRGGRAAGCAAPPAMTTRLFECVRIEHALCLTAAL